MNPQGLAHRKHSVSIRMCELARCWGASSAHFTALAVGYTQVVMHCAMKASGPTLAKI